MYMQGVDNVFDLNFNGGEARTRSPTATCSSKAEQEFSRYNFEFADTELLLSHFRDAEDECKSLLATGDQGERHRHGACRPTISASRPRMFSICSMRAA